MFLKRINSKEGKKRTYWALVKSVRTARGPRHQVVSYLGERQASQKSEWANPARKSTVYALGPAFMPGKKGTVASPPLTRHKCRA